MGQEHQRGPGICEGTETQSLTKQLGKMKSRLNVNASLAIRQSFFKPGKCGCFCCASGLLVISIHRLQSCSSHMLGEQGPCDGERECE